MFVTTPTTFIAFGRRGTHDVAYFLVPLDFIARAEDFFQAFRALPPGNPPSWPRYFLLCHAAELGLRAFLLSRGARESDLQASAFRHNLKKLLAEAIKRGLALSSSARDEIELLDEAHAKFWHRYPRKEAKPVFVQSREGGAGCVKPPPLPCPAIR